MDSLDSSTESVAANKEPSVVQRQELEDVRQLLENNGEPLAGKHIMVPITTKAFFPGKLTPTIKDNEEQVLVKTTEGNLVEMDRSQAIQYLDRRIESLSTATATSTATTTRKTSDGVDAEENEDANVKTSTTETEDSLPFMEIHEELDEQGREVKAEAINVAKQLEFLQRKEGLKAAPSVVAAASTTSTDEEMMMEDEPERKRGVVSDDEYEALSLRLDELARLEEEAEKARTENNLSSKKLQSKGWSKGFLNAKPKTKKTKRHKVSKRPTTSESTKEGRKVGFQPQHEIREIPRIGERSASELKQQKQQLAPAGVNSSSPRKIIEPQVFSGVIRERSVDSNAVKEMSPSSEAPPRKKKLSRFAQERMQQQAAQPR